VDKDNRTYTGPSGITYKLSLFDSDYVISQDTVNAALRSIMASRKLTQRTLSRQLGVNGSWFTARTSNRKCWERRDLFALAYVLNVSHKSLEFGDGLESLLVKTEVDHDDE
jgi:hypothetical protein